MKHKLTMELLLVFLLLVCTKASAQASETTISTDYEEEVEVPSTHVPKFISQPETFTAHEGDTITMPCQVDDIGTFATVWQRGNGTVLFADHIKLLPDAHYVRLDDRSLQLKKLKKGHGGEYLCTISSNPRAILTHTLNVLVPPKIHIHPKHGLSTHKDQPFHLSCEASGNPTPTITWKKLEGELPNGASVSKSHNVSGLRAKVSDSGTYECMATNGVEDPVSATVKVQVLYKPEVEAENRWVHSGEGITTQLSCTVHSNPVANVIWRRETQQPLKENFRMSQTKNRHILEIRKIRPEDFGIYICEARNNLGTGKESIEVSGLASPVVFKSNPTGSSPDSYELKWSTNSYSNVIEYLLRFREVDSSSEGESSKVEDETVGTATPWTEIRIPAVNFSGLVKTSSYEVTGLRRAATYEAVMSVNNMYGWNKPSMAFRFNTEGIEPTTTALIKDAMPAEQGQDSTPHLEEAPLPSEQGNMADKNGNDGASLPTTQAAILISLLTTLIRFY